MLRPIIIARIFFILLATACGYWLNYHHGQPEAVDRASSAAVVAFILAMVIVLFEYSMRTISTKRIVLASVGLLYGLLVSSLVYQTIPDTIIGDPRSGRIVCNFLFGYLGMIIALKHADQLDFGNLKFFLSNPDAGHTFILDTSVIIDGRIKEMILNNFIKGIVIVPTFVIDELQNQSDSSDAIRRNKGRRGLGILEDLQNEFPNMQISSQDYPSVRGVDHKLIEMGRDVGATIVTNDYNLQKVASLHKVPVLNLNELANMLKPAVFVGETFKLLMSREGKEPGQAVGYLKDGTMVVVDDGLPKLNNEIDVVVTSILPTNAGRMVFARPINDGKSRGKKS